MSPIGQRAELIKAALKDYNISGLKLFSIDEIEKSATKGDVEMAPVRLLDLARKSFENDAIFQILGTDSVFKVIDSSGFDRINRKWQLAVCNRPGATLKESAKVTQLVNLNLLHFYDSFSDLEISSSAIRKACKNGDISFVKSAMAPSACSCLI
jgi:nicotinic acid mononucleotide adenylyltransferase